MATRADQAPQQFWLGVGAISAAFTTSSVFEQGLLRRSSSGNLLMIAGVPLALEGDLEARLTRVLDLGYADAAKTPSRSSRASSQHSSGTNLPEGW